MLVKQDRAVSHRILDLGGRLGRFWYCSLGNVYDQCPHQIRPARTLDTDMGGRPHADCDLPNGETPAYWIGPFEIQPAHPQRVDASLECVERPKLVI